MDLSEWTPRGIKRFLPRSLFGRALMILIVPIAALQIVVALVFIERHWDGTTRQLTANFAQELKVISSLVQSQPDEEAVKLALIDASNTLGYAISYQPGEVLSPLIRRPAYGLIPKAIAETLQYNIDAPLSVDTLVREKHVLVQMQLPGGVLRAVPRESRMIASKPHLLLVWMVAAAVALLIVAVLFLRNQVRPIKQLADAAQAFGKGHPAPPFKPSGAVEVRRAAGAFHVMRSRIERQIGQRTLMLSGVSHDLRTPLTRMRLALEMAEDGPETEALKKDVAEMQRMVDGFLDFAKAEEGETPQRVDLAVLVEDVVETARTTGASIELAQHIPDDGDAIALLRPLTIQRCLQNLIGNAVKYGRHVRVTLDAIRTRLDVTIEDDGPGIPEADREEAFKPFHRLDAARNLDKGGGSGLGLSIALDAARAHGGDVTLGNSGMGGLKAVLTLPR